MSRKKMIDPEQILDAAEAIILETGGQAFTLDAVAERAGISKGGLVYTFATKDELIAAALKRELARFQTSVEKRAKNHSSSARLAAQVEQTLSEEEALHQVVAFMLTALMHAPAMLEPCRDYYRRLLMDFDSSTEAGRKSRLAIFAIEGVFLLHGLGLADLSLEYRREILQDARNVILCAATA